MTAEDFAKWFEGFADCVGECPPTLEQWNKIIRQHRQIGVTQEKISFGPAQNGFLTPIPGYNIPPNATYSTGKIEK